MIAALVVLIAGEPGMARRMLADHADDGAGRCSGCRWHNRPTPRHPCVLQVHAEAADQIRATGLVR